MKKRKLELRRETVGHLTDETLSRVAGASHDGGCSFTWCTDTCTQSFQCDTDFCNQDTDTCTCTRPPSYCASCAPTVCC